MRKEKSYMCLECNNKFKSKERNPKFCNRSCSCTYNNKRRNLSKETKESISCSMTKYHENNKIMHLYVCEICNVKFELNKRIKNGKRIHCNKCKRKVVLFKDIYKVRSILELSKRTTCKIIKRMDLGCSNCGWKLASGDIHHINGKKIEDCDNHKNLSYLCPNCHRMVHNKKISKDKLVNLESYIGDVWKEFYNKIIL